MANFEITLTSKAIAFAAKAHAGQMDKCGEPYILHPLRVFDIVKKRGGSDAACAAALLHDVVEDTPVTMHEIKSIFGSEVARIVASVTRCYFHKVTKEVVYTPPKPEVAAEYDKELYREFVMRSKRDPEGKLVKEADLMDNTLPERTACLPEGEKEMTEKRHIPALAFIRDKSATYFAPTPRKEKP